MDQHRPRVLIVDDDLEIRETLAAGLASLECDVMTARDGVEALSMTEVRAPQVVILDLLMPRRGGMAVLHQLKAGRQTGRRYVLMSGSMNERVTQMALELGADVCLQKPFGMPHFLQTVSNLLQIESAAANAKVTEL